MYDFYVSVSIASFGMLFGCIVAVPLSSTVGESTTTPNVVFALVNLPRLFCLGRRMTCLLGVGATFAISYALVITANHVREFFCTVINEHFHELYCLLR
jgi:hypothetical protein